jgi:4-hydroxybenzoate polyprenyltransferase
VKLEHSLFALPLLLAGAVLASSGWPGWWLFIWILVAGVGGRTVAFALNRIIDRAIDAQNPRTAERELPSGEMTLFEAFLVGFFGLAAYVIGALVISPVCLMLAPIPLVVFTIYPYLKRVTRYAHMGVGLALALAPFAGWLACVFSIPSARLSSLSDLRSEWVGVSLYQIPFLTLFTFFWVSGFDIIYSTMDEAFDRQQGLHSLPAKLGREAALKVSAGLHLAAFVCLAVLYLAYFRGPVSGLCLAAIGGLLYFEQKKADNVDLAFFRINAVLGFIVLGFIWAGKARL